MAFIDAGGTRMFYVDEGTGPPLIMGHSLALDHHLYDGAAARLSQRFRVIRPDFRGHGQSDKPYEHYTLEQLTDDLIAFADALGLDRFAYAGLSMGGMVGLRLGMRVPQRLTALALMDTSADLEPNRAAYEAWAEMAKNRPPQDNDIAMFLSISVSQEYLKRNPPELQAIRERMLAADPMGNYYAQLAVLGREPVLDRLSDLTMPCLIVVGQKDMPTPLPQAEAMQQGVADGVLVQVAGAGHLSILERPDIVVGAIEQLMERSR